MISSDSGFQKVLPWLLLILAVILFAAQLRSLFVFPEYNSFRWYGDETWLMSEARQQITTGKVTYPLAIGSQLEHGKGLVLGMTWLSSVLYGLPIWLSGKDPVSVGRCVNVVLALCLLIALYFASRRLGASRLASAIVILLLGATRSFFFASHSARPDLLAGLIVLLVVSALTQWSQNMVPRGNGWWFGFGAILTLLAFSSSVHLITLLGPVTIYFVWQRTKGTGGTPTRRLVTFMVVAGGAISMVMLLGFAYYLGNRSLQLFPPSASNGQFHDVLGGIPIFRPFSRSVQVANIIIRFKQFLSEAPVIFVLLLIVPFIWRWKNARLTFALPVTVVALSWLMLEGAEINYLMHLLPLLFLCLAIAVTRMVNSWGFTEYVFLALGIITLIFGLRDANVVFASGSAIDASNQTAAHIVEASILSSWHSTSKPLVLTEPPLLDRLPQDTMLRVITDHFISFPERTESFNSFFARERINYAVLYNSPAYPKNRPKDDLFYQAVLQNGNVVARYIGLSGDAGRNYFDPSDWRDTILLIKFANNR